MLPFHFENPPALGEKKGGNSVEAGIMEMLSRMEQGKFKVFNTLYDWFDEYRLYHRKDGKIVKIKDDLMAATRYAAMSLRHSTTETSKWNRKGTLGPDVAIVQEINMAELITSPTLLAHKVKELEEKWNML